MCVDGAEQGVGDRGGSMPGFVMLGVYALVFSALGAWRFTRYQIT